MEIFHFYLHLYWQASTNRPSGYEPNDFGHYPLGFHQKQNNVTINVTIKFPIWMLM